MLLLCFGVLEFDKEARKQTGCLLLWSYKGHLNIEANNQLLGGFSVAKITQPSTVHVRLYLWLKPEVSICNQCLSYLWILFLSMSNFHMHMPPVFMRDLWNVTGMGRLKMTDTAMHLILNFLKRGHLAEISEMPGFRSHLHKSATLKAAQTSHITVLRKFTGLFPSLESINQKVGTRAPIWEANFMCTWIIFHHAWPMTADYQLIRHKANELRWHSHHNTCHQYL